MSQSSQCHLPFKDTNAARVATVTAKLQQSARPELEYLSLALGLDVDGKTDSELRIALIGMMN